MRGLGDLQLPTLEWVDWFNHRRLFQDHGRIPPAEFEANHHRHNVSATEAETTEAETNPRAGMKPGRFNPLSRMTPGWRLDSAPWDPPLRDNLGALRLWLGSPQR